MKWIEALKEWNKKSPVWCIPRKGSKEYNEVMAIKNGTPAAKPKPTPAQEMEMMGKEDVLSSKARNLDREEREEKMIKENKAKAKVIRQNIESLFKDKPNLKEKENKTWMQLTFHNDTYVVKEIASTNKKRRTHKEEGFAANDRIYFYSIRRLDNKPFDDIEATVLDGLLLRSSFSKLVTEDTSTGNYGLHFDDNNKRAYSTNADKFDMLPALLKM